MSSPSEYTKGVGPQTISNGSPASRRVAAATRLGAIEEDGGMQPDIPQRAANRPVARFFNIPFAQLYGQRSSPPPYTEYNDVTGPRGEKFSDLRNNRHISKRGGWVRLLVIGLVAVAIIAALAVGLGVGLTRGKGNSRYVAERS